MTLKEYILKDDKEVVYNFYKRIIKNPKDYSSVTRLDIYNEIIALYK